MEEYAYLLRIPVFDKVPFSGVEGILESRVITEAIHLRKYDIDVNLTVKGGIRGLTSRFLLEKAFSFTNVGSMVEFETILALLIYGLILFPNIDNFIDVNSMRIFLIGNLVPTLLGNTYFSIHHRTSKGGGIIVCCVPLLYKWFISHFSQSPIFTENKDCLRWSQRLMSLTKDDITWYAYVYDDVEIIDSYRELSNVPLLGLFSQEGKDTQGLKARIIRVWHNVHKKGKCELGLRNYVALDPYTSWELQEDLDRMGKERDDWEDKFHTSHLEKVELQKQLKEKDDLI
ncbi:uncharacterized protein LOC127103761 [Lathyrus oleraceus]|uniref:uncharacterized protein LOC127103761 n=1 Tax=Pisum sativum TaxID=3888 RepID=UPI0021CDFF8A|nr:uncharacterized protein LOC127103761 [Pisum sativum]